MTVYDLQALPTADALARRRSGRLTMLLVLAACAAPVIASYLSFFVFKPEVRSNYGSLIQPTKTLPDVSARSLQGAPVPLRSLRGQWLLVALGPAACEGACEKRLHAQRQLREMLGRDRDRLDKVWLVTDDAALPPALRTAVVDTAPAVTVLRVPRPLLAQWLAPDPAQALEDHLYLVDPMGEWMMRFPVEFEPSKVKRDLERLLRASASWDRAGR